MVLRGRSTLSTRRDLIVLMSLLLLFPLELIQGMTKKNTTLEKHLSTKWRTDGMKQRALTKPFEIIQQLYLIKG